MATVWTLRTYSDQDYSSAERFGPVRDLTRGSLDVYHVEAMVEDLVVRLLDFEPGDWLVKAGDMLGFAACLWILGEVHGHERVKVLVYGRRTRGYEERVIDFEALRGVCRAAIKRDVTGRE